MKNSTQKTIIDQKTSNITSQYSEDKVILLGEQPYEGSNYTQNMELILNIENRESISIKFPYDGYDMQLFLGDFNGNNKAEIMVRGSFGGSGGFEIAVIYKYENNQLIEIFSQSMFDKENNCRGSFKENYKVHIKCGDKKYSIDISNRPKEYLDLIYNSDGSVKPEVTVYIDSPYAFYPVKQVYSHYYYLLIQQRIVGIVNADTLGVIETLANLLEDKYSQEYRGLLLLPSQLEA
ncbi:hypothetical protein [Romboutsia sp.]|uniref:hypothetical protein n=1 Tax=Romboutsia sp. TaxID=1965302 RepID=UPI003F2D3503